MSERQTFKPRIIQKRCGWVKYYTDRPFGRTPPLAVDLKSHHGALREMLSVSISLQRSRKEKAEDKTLIAAFLPNIPSHWSKIQRGGSSHQPFFIIMNLILFLIGIRTRNPWLNFRSSSQFTTE